MKCTIIDGPANTATVVLDGKLDLVGAGAVETPLSVAAGAKRGLILDLSALTFIASIGIRHLVTAAKVVGRKGGRVVLMKPSATVREVLETSGVTELMSIVATDSEARMALGLSD